MSKVRFENREGQRVPTATFRTRREHEWISLTSDDVFAGKTVVVFSLPGAFTPTCSSSHVPRFNKLAPLFRKSGVDDIVCISVNDAFVMNEWKENQHADNVTFLPDGNGEFTEAMGLLVGKQDLGFGKRSWRYSMLVRDGVIEKMFVEPQEPGDPYEVSDADTMLRYVAPDAAAPLDVTIFTRNGCPSCAKAKGLLRDAGIGFEELRLNREYTDQTLRAVAGATSVPQVFVGGEHIGGAEDLEAWLSRNDPIVRKAAA
ncbi:MAG TPA: glutathione peroxidase [Woeseiaceae bacterium]|nr:glutathione peroxidase [Woeseiaceae bacterium]